MLILDGAAFDATARVRGLRGNRDSLVAIDSGTSNVGPAGIALIGGIEIFEFRASLVGLRWFLAILGLCFCFRLLIVGRCRIWFRLGREALVVCFDRFLLFLGLKLC